MRGGVAPNADAVDLVAAPIGARPAVPVTGVDDADVAEDTSMSPEPHRRHASDGLHCFHRMLAVATAATTSTRITAAAVRPALLE